MQKVLTEVKIFQKSFRAATFLKHPVYRVTTVTNTTLGDGSTPPPPKILVELPLYSSAVKWIIPQLTCGYAWHICCVVEGLNPVWHETLEFKVHSPDLAFVVFIVFAKNVSIAQFAMPYRCLQQGNWSVSLCFNTPFYRAWAEKFCLSVRPSVRHVPVLYRHGLKYRRTFFSMW